MLRGGPPHGGSSRSAEGVSRETPPGVPGSLTRGPLRTFIPIALCALLLALPADGQTPDTAAPPVTGANTATAATGLERELRAEIDRANEVLAGLQRQEEALPRVKTGREARLSAVGERVGKLALDLNAAKPATPAVDRIFDELGMMVGTARDDLEAALNAWRDPPQPPGFSAGLDPETLLGTPLEEQARELMRLESDIETAAVRFRDAQRESLWLAVEADAEQVSRISGLRIRAMPLLTPAKRQQILGLSREGFQQFRREIRQLSLSARLWVASRLRTLRELPSMLGDMFALGTATLVLLRLVFVFVVLLFVRRRGGGLLTAAKQAAFGRVRSVSGMRRLEALSGIVEVIAPWVAWLVGLWLLRWGLGMAASWPESIVVYRLAVLYVFYRLAIDVSFSMIVKVVRRYHLSMDTARRMLLIRSVRTIIRAVVLIGVLFVLSRQVLGTGFLYGLVVGFSWLVVLAAAVRVLSRWRQIIAAAYLASAPEGRLADLVKRTRDRWYGVFVAAASLGWLAGRAAAIMARDFALTFDQTRKALAFVFRRRMEKQAEQKGYAEGRIDQLPAALVQAFSEKAISEGPLVVDRFPGLDRLAASLKEWSAGGWGGSFVVVGEPGMGKTSWLGRLDAGDLPVERLPLNGRLLRAADVSRAAEPLIRDEGGRRVIVVDTAHNLFLAAVGGYEALEEFVAVVERTCDRIFWLCAFNAFSWEHLKAVRPDLAVFRDHQVLTPWSETAIRDLIRTRMTVTGVDLTYEDLVVDRMEGVTAEARFLRTEEGYTRLLWDYADGNPRIALHFWLRSLVPDSETRARVRLFRAPGTKQLEEIPEEGLFVLAAVVTHENLSAEETVAVTAYPERICSIHLDRLIDMGVLRADDGRHRVRPHWQKAVTRLLSRRNLLPD